MRVFISYSSQDRPAVEQLALGLEERGIECWWDRWHIGPQDDIVAAINRGLLNADAGIIVFSRHSRDSRWIEAEVSYLTWARIEEQKPLIVVAADADPFVPPLLRPIVRRGIAEIDAICDAVHNRKPGPPHRLPQNAAEYGRTEHVRITLSREPSGAVRVMVRAGGMEYADESRAALPRRLIEAQAAFLRGFKSGLRRSPEEATRASLEAEMAELGLALREFCLPRDSGVALAELADGCKVGGTVEVCFATSDPVLLALPFEALRLPDDRVLATHPTVVLFRSPVGVAGPTGEPLAGPLKILVAVGAPDEGQSGGAVLDQERELQNILDAVAPAQRHENVEVRILEVGHPEAIGTVIAADAYHVLHLSCHGLPGALELENEDGGAVRVTADDLLQPIRRAGRPLPMVLLNSCKGGVYDGQTASFAEALLRAGVPCVLAMQTSVSDLYATRLARAFYENLALRELHLPGRALAEARKTLEAERQAAIRGGAHLRDTQPEYATAGLFVAGEPRPLANFGLDRQPLKQRPVYEVSGPVPQLRLDDLIGRRSELREVLRTLRDPNREFAGVVLTGIGGVGKSAVAGRAMQRLAEEGWLVPAHTGRWDLAAIALAVGVALGHRGDDLTRPDLDDRVRLQLLAKVLAEEPLVLVLDDFEQNLAQGGGKFLDADVARYLELLSQNARRGRLLITCRYPVPGAESFLRRIAVGPLSQAEIRKLLLRLPGLRGMESAELSLVLRAIGGHPRMLEFLDAVLRGGKSRLPHVSRKLQEVRAGLGIDLKATTGGLEEGLQSALALGARDVFLEELVALARQEGTAEALLQVAVSNLRVTPQGLARMLEPGGDVTTVERNLERLADLSLIHRFPDGTAWVHRWTAQGLARMEDADVHRARSNRAGRYRWWRVEHESHGLEDVAEAVRNFLAGQDYDAAAETALACLQALRRFQRSIGIAAFASEVLETLPESHPKFVLMADQEAHAHLALGFTDRALARYGKLLGRQQRLVAAEPERADYQRDLSVSYDRMGDLYRALGKGERARQAFEQSLAIREQLAEGKPERADYQRDLSTSYQRMGNLYRALGEGERARQAFEQSLTITERLVAGEPKRADYQRDLSVSYNNMGDVYRVLGQGERARQAYEQSLAIREQLVTGEPKRADYQRDLSISYERMGDLYRAFGKGERARQAYEQSLAIAERLAAGEPERADYQHDLSVAYDKMGDLYRALGDGEGAQQAYEQSLAIAERLVAGEPERADYQRDLSVSYNNMGDVYRMLGQWEEARQAYEQSRAITERLVAGEPKRADYQRDLSVSYERRGDLYRALGEREPARQAYQQSLAIRERLAAGEPDQADCQIGLVKSLAKVATASAPVAKQDLQRALSILESLKNSGRLAPAEEWMIPDLRRRIAEADPASS